jgi:S1-C subfamily serine protease
MADAVARAGGSVVRVDGRRRLGASGVVWRADGAIVTASHVLDRDDAIRVGLPDGRAVDAALVGRDPSTDLAVLRTAEVGLQAANWAGHQGLRAGVHAMVVARPGAWLEAGSGIVAAVSGPWRTWSGGMIDAYVRTDVAMHPGFSGGAVVDPDGRVLGVATSALVSGASIAVPTTTVERVALALWEHGRIRRGYLGVTVQPARLGASAAIHAGQPGGLLVAAVEPGSPADAAGISVGDVLLAMDGVPLRGVDDLMASLGGDRVEREVVVRLLRAGTAQDVHATIAERPR